MLIKRERMRERLARHDLETHRVREREPLIGKPSEPPRSRVAEEADRNGLPLVRRILDETPPGSAFEFLVETASDRDIPADLSARPDHYLYAGGYEQWFRERKAPAPPKKRARIR